MEQRVKEIRLRQFLKVVEFLQENFNVSKSDICRAIDRSPAFLNNIVTGHDAIGNRVQKNICQYLKVNEDWLNGDESCNMFDMPLTEEVLRRLVAPKETKIDIAKIISTNMEICQKVEDLEDSINELNQQVNLLTKLLLAKE